MTATPDDPAPFGELPSRLRAANAMTHLPERAATRLRALLGDRFRIDGPTRTENSHDWWPISKVWLASSTTASTPAAVAGPASAGEVLEVLTICRESNIPVTTAAGRSAVCGQAVPVGGGLVIDMTNMDRIIDIDDESCAVTVEPGIFGHVLERKLNDAGYTLGHFPQSIEISTVGGWIACRSAGQFSTRYGKIEDLLIGLEVALARPESDGRTISIRAIPAGATGLDLRSVFLGSEGTLGVITQATLKISPLPEARESAAFLFPTFADGLRAIRRTMRRGAAPACLRLYDPTETARHFGAGDGAAMIAICEGDQPEVDRQMHLVREESTAASDADPEWIEHWLETRNDVSALDVAISQGIVVDTIEVAALWRNIEGAYSAIRDAIAAVTGTMLASAHSSHAYRTGACLYFTFAGAAPDSSDLLAGKDEYYACVWAAAMDAAQTAGATPSHHHGIGLVRLAALEREIGPAGVGILRALKRELDPAGILNPGKLGSDPENPIGRVPWPPQNI